jgi:2-oxoglutarate ferredoxin oxidoreductase subunit beta
MLNNGVFGDTGGQLTATTVLGQRTKTSIAGRDADQHGYPVPVAGLVAQLQGAGYVARAAVHTAGAVAQTKRMLRRAFECQLEGRGFGLVEILTMCPTGWFVTAPDGPGYLADSMEKTYPLGELVGP